MEDARTAATRPDPRTGTMTASAITAVVVVVAVEEEDGAEGAAAAAPPGRASEVSGLSHKIDMRDLEAAFSKIGRRVELTVFLIFLCSFCCSSRHFASRRATPRPLSSVLPHLFVLSSSRRSSCSSSAPTVPSLPFRSSIVSYSMLLVSPASSLPRLLGLSACRRSSYASFSPAPH
ncbi:hypothetical protein C8R44DRAFT_990772 [Mycena epipterygia]|nr:hypothetical protein C8R44DRAFT_990772 [Mycena epipterygia]